MAGPLAAILIAGLLVLLLPDRAWAWGPATHVCLGTGLLESAHLLPAALRDLVVAYPRDFLYGSVAADISVAKKYVPAGRHCHHWPVGEEIFRAAETDRLRAVGVGYLAHLAADTVAHNTYVPRQLLLTSSTRALGHSYWEHRMDVQLPERYTRVAREVVMNHDHTAADELFDDVLSGTLFTFQTNRRIFRGMIRFQDNDRWHAVFSRVLDNSRWTLTPDEIDGYLARSFDYMVNYLRHREESLAVRLDPVGETNIRAAKRLRREALANGRAGSPRRLLEIANQRFPLEELRFDYWHTRNAPAEEG